MEAASPIVAASGVQCFSYSEVQGTAGSAPSSSRSPGGLPTQQASLAPQASLHQSRCRCSAACGLFVVNVFQFLITLARLFSPRPLSAVSSLFLLCLGWKAGPSRALLRLFFLAFFSVLFGVSDLFWLIVKCTGPYGLAWLQPKYYWRPLYSASFSHEVPLESPSSLLAVANFDPQRRLLPPERPPAAWQIFCELGAFCLSPPVCFLGAWLAWRVYKRQLALMSSDSDLLLPPLHSLGPLYGSASSIEEAMLHSQLTGQSGASLVQHSLISTGGRSFVPFSGEGRRLGVDSPEEVKGEEEKGEEKTLLGESA